MATATDIPEPLVSTWQCQLPIRVCVAPNSISSPTALPPFYILASRQGYVSSIYTQLWHMVQHVLPKLPGSTQPKPWFDFNGVPLKSTLPLGVLFDLLVTSNSHGLAPGSDNGDSSTAGHLAGLPWQLTLHYTHAPPETSASWLASLPHHTQFMNSLKEACHICRGTDGSAAVMRMDGAAQDALWLAVEKGDSASYRTLLASLKVVPSPRSQGAIPPNIPVRLFLRKTSTTPPAGSEKPNNTNTTWDSVISTSRPVPAVTPDGMWVTLWDALHSLIPQLVPEPPPHIRTPAPPSIHIPTRQEAKPSPSLATGTAMQRQASVHNDEQSTDQHSAEAVQQQQQPALQTAQGIESAATSQEQAAAEENAVNGHTNTQAPQNENQQAGIPVTDAETLQQSIHDSDTATAAVERQGSEDVHRRQTTSSDGVAEGRRTYSLDGSVIDAATPMSPQQKSWSLTLPLRLDNSINMSASTLADGVLAQQLKGGTDNAQQAESQETSEQQQHEVRLDRKQGTASLSLSDCLATYEVKMAKTTSRDSAVYS